MTDLKKGYMIVCKKRCVMNDKSIATTLNKSYEIIWVNSDDDHFDIYDDGNETHGYDIDKKSESYYGKWFYTPAERKKLRKKKLQKLSLYEKNL